MAQALQITARPEKGFRRAGIHHPPTPVTHPIDRFTKEQLAALKAEKQLIVSEVELPVAKPEPQGAAGGAKR